MNISKLTSAIESAFTHPKKTLPGCLITVPRAPVDLDSLIQDAVENEEDEEDIYNYGTEEVLERHGWACSTLVAFYWQSLGPMVWQACLQTLSHKEGLSFALWRQDVDPCRQVIAQLRPASRGDIFRVLFEKLIEANGAAFGLQLFGSLPSNTHDMAEDLIPEKAVRRSYWKWMVWAECRSSANWTALAEEVSARARSPIAYPLEILRGLSAVDNPGEWLEEHRQSDAKLSLRAKRAIFDAYFQQSYGPY